MDEIGTPLALTVMDWLASALHQARIQYCKLLKWGKYYEKIRYDFGRRRCLGIANGTCASRDFVFVVVVVDGWLLDHWFVIFFFVVEFVHQRWHANPRYDLSIPYHHVSCIGRLQWRSRVGCSGNPDHQHRDGHRNLCWSRCQRHDAGQFVEKLPRWCNPTRWYLHRVVDFGQHDL